MIENQVSTTQTRHTAV